MSAPSFTAAHNTLDAQALGQRVTVEVAVANAAGSGPTVRVSARAK